MIHYIEPFSREQNSALLREYFMLRKSVFCDQLGWVEASADGIETDVFDDMFNVCILNLDDNTRSVTGGVRLMPTTGPTLMRRVWAGMLPRPDAYRAPEIWEATRFCVDDRSNRSRKRSLVNRATLALSLAVLEFCDANAIRQVIGVCEQKFFDMQRVYGTSARIISSKTDENGTEIGCGLWDTGPDARAGLAWARAFLGESEPLRLAQVA